MDAISLYDERFTDLEMILDDNAESGLHRFGCFNHARRGNRPRVFAPQALYDSVQVDMEADERKMQRHAAAMNAWDAGINDIVMVDGEWTMAGRPAPESPDWEDPDSFAASDEWNDRVHGLGRRFWEPWAFYNPFLSGIRATDGFVAASLQTNPQSLREMCNDLFPAFSLDVHLSRDRREDIKSDGMTPNLLGNAHWSIPVYPGMTRQDLIDAAGPIVEQVNVLYQTRTVGHLIDAARCYGMTQRDIADHLGLTVDAVRKHLNRK